jgi:hypothetical protein
MGCDGTYAGGLYEVHVMKGENPLDVVNLQESVDRSAPYPQINFAFMLMQEHYQHFVDDHDVLTSQHTIAIHSSDGVATWRMSNQAKINPRVFEEKGRVRLVLVSE